MGELLAAAAWAGKIYSGGWVDGGGHTFASVEPATDRQLMIALHRHDDNDGSLFTETTTGLDHGGFAVPSRRDLELWQDHLETNGVVRADTADKPLTQSPIADEPYASVLVFRDPDNIQLELFAPALQRED